LKPFYLIDTSAWIELFRSKGNVATAAQIRDLQVQNRAVWCEMVRLELWNGARGDREAAALQKVQATTILLPTTAEVWVLADQLARKARLSGKTFPPSDLLIAACARVHGAEIVHRDKHFDLLKAL